MQVGSEIVLCNNGVSGRIGFGGYCYRFRFTGSGTWNGRLLVRDLDVAVNGERPAFLQVLSKVPRHASCSQAVNLQKKETDVHTVKSCKKEK